MPATAIVLAGGKSSRMGTNKALLKMDEQFVIERIIVEVKKVVEQVIIVTNSFSEYDFLQLPMVEDTWKEKGPLAGIHAGLTASTTEKNMVIACDMPFVSAEIVQHLLDSLDKYEAVVPLIDQQLHPLFACYKKDVAQKANQSIENGELRLKRFLQGLHVKVLAEEDLPFRRRVMETSVFNMNHPEEYKKALEIDSYPNK